MQHAQLTVGIEMHSQVGILTMVDNALILFPALFAYCERLYFSISIALISAVAKFMKGSDEVWTSYYKKAENK